MWCARVRRRASLMPSGANSSWALADSDHCCSSSGSSSIRTRTVCLSDRASMLAAAFVATKTSVLRYRHRTTRTGRTRVIQAWTSSIASTWNEIVFEPSRAHVVWRRPTHVGAGAESEITDPALDAEGAAGAAGAVVVVAAAAGRRSSNVGAFD